MRAVVDTNILVRALIKPQDTVGPVLSGDLDLLVLSPIEGIPILEPAAFLSRLAEP